MNEVAYAPHINVRSECYYACGLMIELLIMCEVFGLGHVHCTSRLIIGL